MITVALKVMITGRQLFPFNRVCNRNKWTFLRKILLSVCDWGGGLTTQRLCAILVNRLKKVGKHCRRRKLSNY